MAKFDIYQYPTDTLLQQPDYLQDVHNFYEDQLPNWMYYIRSYMGGEEYKGGRFLQEYNLELEGEYENRINNTPVDNHCRNIVHIYSSFLFRTPPTREYGSLNEEPNLESFLKDCDFDGQSFNGFMKNAQIFASVYGNCWIFVDKPSVQADTLAQEIDMEIRPYLTLFTPENVVDWHYDRMMNGKYVLDYCKVREEITDERELFRIWTPQEIKLVEMNKNKKKSTVLDVQENQLGMIPAVILYNKRTPRRAIGLSDLQDIADIQRAIYNELSEMEQLIRLTNHPSLVKTSGVEASAGAGSVIQMPDELDSGLKPYLLQPSGSNLQSIQNSIEQKIEMIDRITHMSGVRQTKSQVTSGIALQTEFENLNSVLSEKADLLENAEEQIWRLYGKYQQRDFDGSVEYPDSFNLRDYASDLQYLQMARASGVQSSTFRMEVDKQIAEAVVDDDQKLKEIVSEIESQTEVGQFTASQVMQNMEENNEQ
tara:strand:- start:869 stop:2314 length:1446 start_codon:yes stop_codon:yes gene_type:complete